MVYIIDKRKPKQVLETINWYEIDQWGEINYISIFVDIVHILPPKWFTEI